jgi:hypothetical protein
MADYDYIVIAITAYISYLISYNSTNIYRI